MERQILNPSYALVPHTRFTTWMAVLAAAFMLVLPKPVLAAKITPPPVPAEIQVPAGNQPYLVGHATGTQNYICLPSPDSDTGVAYKLFTPQATLYDDQGEQLTTHFFSPNPAENGTVRAAWQDAKDTSSVWGQVLPGDASTDPAFVAPGSIPWLLVTMAGTQEGPTGGDRLTNTTYIQRVNTAGGVAPMTGCSSSTEIGTQAFVPYTTDYIFYRAEQGN